MNIISALENFYLWNNSGVAYFKAIVVFFGLLIILKLFQLIILSRLKKFAQKTKTDVDDALIDMIAKVKWPFYFLFALYFGLEILNTPILLMQITWILFVLAIVYEAIRAVGELIDFFIGKYLDKVKNGKEEKKQRLALVRASKAIVKIILWAIGLTLILSNMGINVTSIIASLGIGGIAVALALQNILGDVFSSFAIFVDKPFEVGDFIKISDTEMGTVEKIGLKTTRIRSVDGEELIVGNKDLTNANLRNLQRLEKRRAVVKLGVVYETTQTKLKKIPGLLKKIVKEQKSAVFDRCHFVDYGDFSLNFELVYFVKTKEYAEFLDAKQKINFEIFKQFASEGIEFAYPTQTVFVNNKNLPQLSCPS